MIEAALWGCLQLVPLPLKAVSDLEHEDNTIGATPLSNDMGRGAACTQLQTLAESELLLIIAKRCLITHAVCYASFLVYLDPVRSLTAASDVFPDSQPAQIPRLPSAGQSG